MRVFVNQHGKDKSGTQLRDENDQSKIANPKDAHVFKIVFTVYPSAKSDQ